MFTRIMTLMRRTMAWTSYRSGRQHSFAYDHVLGTSFEVTIDARSYADAERACREMLGKVDRLERILSSWSSTSELSAWLSTYDEDVRVSDELAEVLDLAERWRVRTNGAFDPAAQRSERAPDGPRWYVDRSRGVARRLTRSPISLDAIAKGYIIDRAVEQARALPGVRAILLNIGGDVRHQGPKATKFGVTNPFEATDNSDPLAVATIRNEGVATSGGYRRGIRREDRLLSHIIDPGSGESVHRVVSATVIAPDCTSADALSTAFSVLTPLESVALADSLSGVGCLIVEADGKVTTNNSWSLRASQ